MLVLQRDKSDAVVITAPNGDRITVCVVRGGGKLGFDAPKGYSIHRKEIQEQIDRELLTSNEHAKEWERE